MNDIFVDTSKPNLNSISIANEQYFSLVSIPVNGELDESIEKVLINGKEAVLNENKKNFEFELLVTQDDLNFPIRVEAFDLAGNALTKEYVIKIDRGLPQIVNRIESNIFTNIAEFLVNYSITDLDEVVSKILVNGIEQFNSTDNVVEKIVLLSNGTNSIEIQGIDKAGNISISKIEDIYYDSSIPVLSEVSPSVNESILGVKVIINGKSNKKIKEVRANGQNLTIGANGFDFSGSFTFSSIGNKNIEITLMDIYGNTATESRETILIAPNSDPVAILDVNDLNPGKNEVIQFNGASSYDDSKITKYEWRINGSLIDESSNQYDVDFSGEGQFIVELTVYDDTGKSNSISKTINVTEKKSPIAFFSYSVPNLQQPKAIILDASQSTDEDGTIVKYIWNIDGKIIETSSSILQYDSPSSGEKFVELVIKDNDNKSNRSSMVVSVNSLPLAAINSKQSVFRLSYIVVFDAGKSFDDNGISSYEWNLGDGTKKVTSTPILEHKYYASGDYLPSVKVFDTQGSYGEAVSSPIHINFLPNASFVKEQEKVKAPSLVKFNALTSSDIDGQIVRYNWIFPNGVIKKGREVSHNFISEGLFDISLEVIDNLGDISRTIQQVNVLPNDSSKANFVASKTYGHVPELIKFDGSMSYDDEGIIDYEWKLNGIVQSEKDSTLNYNFIEKGKYLVELTVTDRQGEKDSKALEIFIRGENEAPIASFLANKYRANPPFLISLNAEASLDSDENISSYHWDFDDGKKQLSRDSKVSHLYNSSGVFNVTLTVKDSEGESSSVIKQIEMNYAPIAIFSSGVDTFNPPFEVEFDASASSDDRAIALYKWRVGNQAEVSSILPNYNFNFTEAGKFDVRLTVVDDEGMESSFLKEVRANAPPIILGTIDSVIGDYPLVSKFNFSQSIDDSFVSKYIFNYGDGSPLVESVTGITEHVYQTSGDYIAKVMAIDNQGLESESTFSISVKPNQVPNVSFSIDSLVKKAPVELTFDENSSSDDKEIKTIKWFINDSLVSEGDLTFSKLFSTPGQYNVSLEIVDDQGSVSRLTKIVEIQANEVPTSIFSMSASSAYNPASITFDASSSYDDEEIS